MTYLRSYFVIVKLVSTFFILKCQQGLTGFFQIELCQPEALHIMDGSLDEDRRIKSQLVKSGVLIPLPKYNNCFLARTDPKVILKDQSGIKITEQFQQLEICYK